MYAILDLGPKNFTFDFYVLLLNLVAKVDLEDFSIFHLIIVFWSVALKKSKLLSS